MFKEAKPTQSRLSCGVHGGEAHAICGGDIPAVSGGEIPTQSRYAMIMEAKPVQYAVATFPQ